MTIAGRLQRGERTVTKWLQVAGISKPWQQVVFGHTLLSGQTAFGQVRIAVAGISSSLFMLQPSLACLGKGDRRAIGDVNVIGHLPVDFESVCLSVSLVLKPLLAAKPVDPEALTMMGADLTRAFKRLNATELSGDGSPEMPKSKTTRHRTRRFVG